MRPSSLIAVPNVFLSYQVITDARPRIVTSAARSHPKPRAPIQAGCPVVPDNRRNLYVLGLPFDSSECVA
jgi:hypothetical protein